MEPAAELSAGEFVDEGEPEAKASTLVGCASTIEPLAIVPCGGVAGGAGLGGKICCFALSASNSKLLISDSICHLNSLLARLNSFMNLPIVRMISGSFFGPTRIRAARKMKI